jgi:hypothetical protein
MIFRTLLRAFKGKSTRRAEPDSGAQAADDSFSYLAARPSVPGWKRKLYSLIEGESDETLSRLGSIEQYVRVLLRESGSTDARYYFSEALSQIVQEWTSTVAEPADRLYNMLALIGGFTPSAGFVKTLDYLNRCGSLKRGNELVSSELRPVDLYKKGLAVLGRYYPRPPQRPHEDLGFQSYTQLLEKNLEDSHYAEYAAGKLLDLGLLDIKSKKISALLLSRDDIFAEVFRHLLAAAEGGEAVPVESRLGDLLTICARASSPEKFEVTAAAFGAKFEPEGDYEVYFPTLRLSSGAVLNVHARLDDIMDTPLARHVGYDEKRLGELLTASSVEPDKIAKYVAVYLTRIIEDEAAIRSLNEELKAHEVSISPQPEKNSFVLKSPKKTSLDGLPLDLEKRVVNKYFQWWFKNNNLANDAPKIMKKVAGL